MIFIQKIERMSSTAFARLAMAAIAGAILVLPPFVSHSSEPLVPKLRVGFEPAAPIYLPNAETSRSAAGESEDDRRGGASTIADAPSNFGSAELGTFEEKSISLAALTPPLWNTMPDTANQPRKGMTGGIIVLAQADNSIDHFAVPPLPKPRDVHLRGTAMASWPLSAPPMIRPQGLGLPKFSSKSSNRPPTQQALEMVRYHGTEQNVVDTNRVHLIGVFGSGEKRKALVRFANGSVKKVQVNSKLLDGRVISIGSDHVTFARNGRAYRIKLGN